LKSSDSTAYYNFNRGASDHIIVFVASLTEPMDLKPGWEIAAFDFFNLDALPELTSLGTRRRIEEYLSRASGTEYKPW
jgi:hypothetical protein